MYITRYIRFRVDTSQCLAQALSQNERALGKIPKLVIVNFTATELQLLRKFMKFCSVDMFSFTVSNQFVFEEKLNSRMILNQHFPRWEWILPMDFNHGFLLVNIVIIDNVVFTILLYKFFIK